MTLARTTTESPRAARGPIKVFLAEDHAITLWGLEQLIEASSPRMSVVGTARTRAELVNHAAAAQADVIVLDLDLDGEDATNTIPVLRQRCPGQVLILTAAVDADLHRAAVMKGARGVVHKAESAETVLLAIEKVHRGEVWLHREMLGDVLGELTGGKPAAARRTTDPDAERITTLTPRERDVIRMMVTHPADKQFAVADELGISEHTLRNHLTTIYSKIDVHGRLELHVFAVEHGLGTAGNGGKGQIESA